MSGPRRTLLAAALALAALVAACDAGTPGAPPAPTADAGPGTSGSTGPTPVPTPSAPVPGTGAGGATDSGGTDGGGSAPNPGTGVLGPDEPVLVAPVPNVRDIRDVGAATLEAAVDGRRVTARLTWWSGVEPCTALAGIAVARGEREITLTIREGNAAGPDAMCTAQVIHKAASVDLGELAPETWTIRAIGEARPVEVVVED